MPRLCEQRLRFLEQAPYTGDGVEQLLKRVASARSQLVLRVPCLLAHHPNVLVPEVQPLFVRVFMKSGCTRFVELAHQRLGRLMGGMMAATIGVLSALSWNFV